MSKLKLMRLINERKKIHQIFWLVLNYVVYTLTRKTTKNIAHTDFLNGNIALNLHSYEENLGFIKEFIKNMYLLLLFK